MEQWACSRIHPTFVITTYTGLEEHSVLVSVLSVPTSEDAWSPRLRVYFKAISQFHARKKDTPLGTLMVTNLSGFPSALTVIAVPEGDVKKHREHFIVNENLKRMGCLGRTGLTLALPAGATQGKFTQIYRTSDRVPLYTAVIELVKLCQIALVLFLKLAPEYVDGLLCDITEAAINDWWTEVGTEFFNTEPNDGILGPTTVASLLGLLIGARNRLNAFGAPITKDVFDLGNTKRGIAYFQKSQKIRKTRRFDRQTLDRLHKVTAKAASGEGWTVPRAIKSTVAELSGKGGDMMLSMVGARDKPGIAEVESTDMETFIRHAQGERCKWLWHGKPRKNSENDMFSNLGGDETMMFSKDDTGNYTWPGKKRTSIVDEAPPEQTNTDGFYLQSTPGSQTSLDPADKEQILRRTVLKSVTEKMNDARSGLGRIKDAVGISGLRGHHARPSRDDTVTTNVDEMNEKQRSADASLRCSIDRPRYSNEAESISVNQSESVSRRISNTEAKWKESNARPRTSDSCGSTDTTRPYVVIPNGRYSERKPSDHKYEDHHIQASDEKSSENYSNQEERYQNKLKECFAVVENPRKHSFHADIMGYRSTYSPLLRTPQSVPDLRDSINEPRNTMRNDFRWQRHLSFNAMVDVVAAGEQGRGNDEHSDEATEDPYQALVSEKSKGYELENLAERLSVLRAGVGAWVQHKVSDIEELDIQAGRDQEELDIMYHQKSEEYHTLRGATEDLTAEEKGSLTEAVKEIDILDAKLEYELNALESKVEDVESSVAEFDRQVLELETRASGLRHENEVSESWPRRLTSLCTVFYTRGTR